jgi:hypothetical protein
MNISYFLSLFPVLFSTSVVSRVLQCVFVPTGAPTTAPTRTVTPGPTGVVTPAPTAPTGALTPAPTPGTSGLSNCSTAAHYYTVTHLGISSTIRRASFAGGSRVVQVVTVRNKDPAAVNNLVLQVAAVNVKYIRSFTSPTVIFNGNDQLLTSTPFNLGGDKYPNTKRLPFSKAAKFYIVFKAAECPTDNGVSHQTCCASTNSG